MAEGVAAGKAARPAGAVCSIRLLGDGAAWERLGHGSRRLGCQGLHCIYGMACSVGECWTWGVRPGRAVVKDARDGDCSRGVGLVVATGVLAWLVGALAC